MKRSFDRIASANDELFLRRSRKCAPRRCVSMNDAPPMTVANEFGEELMVRSSDFDLLGEDGLLRHVFGFLNVRDHQIVRSCCRKWKKLIECLELDVLDMSVTSPLTSTNIDRAFLSIVHHYSSVKRIDLSGQRSLMDRDILVLASCFWTNLEDLVVDDCIELTDFGLLSVLNAQSYKLRSVSMRHCKLITGNFALTQVNGRHPSLHTLDFFDTRVSYALANGLDTCFPSLQVINAAHTPAHFDFLQEMRWEESLQELQFVVKNEHCDLPHLEALLADFEARCIRERTAVVSPKEAKWSVLQRTFLASGKKLLADVPLDRVECCSALMYACEHGLSRMVTHLLRIANAEMEVTDKDNSTPLCVAIASGSTPTVRTLVAHGANVNQRTRCLATPFYLACELDYEDIVNVLLEHKKLKVDVTVAGGATAVCVAAKNGNRSIVSQLLHRHKTSECSSSANQLQFVQALFLACERGHSAIVSELLDTLALDANVLMDNSVTPLYLACQMGHDEIVQMLLMRGADPNFRRPHGVSCLYIAAQEGKTRIVERLIQFKVNIHARMEDLSTALHIAARMGHVAVAQVLLQHGAQIDEQTRSGLTPLYIASEEGHQEMVSFFLRHHASLDKQTKNGTTPLFVASQKGHAVVVHALLEAGANAQLPKNNGTFPMDAASLLGNYEVTKLLLQYGARVGGLSLHFAERRRDLKLQALLMDRYYAQHMQQFQSSVAATQGLS